MSGPAAASTEPVGLPLPSGKRAAQDGPVWERIVNDAAGLFAARGYHATGISDILAAIGLSRGALYYYIEGKETLLYTICRAQLDLMNGEARQMVDRDLPAEERLRLLARKLLVGIAEHLDEWTVFFHDYRALGKDNLQHILTARAEYEGYWHRVLNEGAETGEFQVVSSLRTKGILGMFNYAYVWMRPHGRSTPEEIADDFVSMLLSGLRSS